MPLYNALLSETEAIRSNLEGILERIVFFREETGFTVARLQVARRRELVTMNHIDAGNVENYSL